MGNTQRFSTLEFDDDHAFDYEVGIIVANLSAKVIDVNRLLPPDSQAHGFQFKCQGVLINLLQKPIAQLVIDSIETFNNLCGQVLMFQCHTLIRANPSNPRHPWSISFRALSRASPTRAWDVPPAADLLESDDSILNESYKSSSNTAENP